MSVGEGSSTGISVDGVWKRAQWLLDHPEEGERLVGEMLERQGETTKQERIDALRSLFAALCKDAQCAGALSDRQSVDPTCFTLTGRDERTGAGIIFTIRFPIEDKTQVPAGTSENS